MATATNNTAETDRERLAEASLEGCYLETLLAVIETAFEEIDAECDYLPEGQGSRIRSIARQGLNLAYMAQDKAKAVKDLTDALETELWQAERRLRSESQAGVQ